MDIIFPAKDVVSGNNNLHYVKSTDKEVVCRFSMIIRFISYISLLLPTNRPILHMQGKEVNLFQPAREFLPLIDEVCDSVLFVRRNTINEPVS